MTWQRFLLISAVLTVVLVAGAETNNAPTGTSLVNSALCSHHPTLCQGRMIVWVVDEVRTDVCHLVLEVAREKVGKDDHGFAVLYVEDAPAWAPNFFRRQRTAPLLISAGFEGIPLPSIAVPGRAFELLDGIVIDSIPARR